MQYLRADTITEVVVGPAVAVGDGFTPVTGLVGASADEFELIKHNATTTTVIAGTLAAITGADGYYALDLNATDCNTEGRLTLLINDDTLILPIRMEFMVLKAQVFDSFFTNAADILDVNVAEVSQDAAAADNLEAACDNYSVTRGLTGTALPAVAAQAVGGLFTRGTGVGQINAQFNGRIDVDVVAMGAAVITATSIAASAIQNSKLANDLITAGKLALNCIGADELSVTAINEIRDAILDELTASHVGAGSVGEVLNNLPNDGALTFLDASILARTLASGGYFDPTVDDVDVRSLQANVITAAAINAAAITAAKLAADAITSTVLAASAAQKIRDEILPTQNAAFSNLQFLFVDSTDHVTPVTGATTISGTRSIDGGAFVAVSGAIAEIGNGLYQFDALAADMDGGIITFRFIATGGTPNAPDDAFVTIVTGGGV